ncbi:hypothetical protein [Photobacterium damselae]|uniref:hypothetical protein n=1 Tax=Photobacterium damselae TaxID=38293 RepID=UPI003BAE70A5
MNTQNNPFDSLMPPAMAHKAEEVGVYKATKHPLQSFFLAVAQVAVLQQHNYFVTGLLFMQVTLLVLYSL